MVPPPLPLVPVGEGPELLPQGTALCSLLLPPGSLGGPVPRAFRVPVPGVPVGTRDQAGVGSLEPCI